MALVGQTGGQCGQASGYNNCTETFQEALVTSLGPGIKTTSNLKPREKKSLHKLKQNTLKPAKNRPEKPQPKATRTRQFTRAKTLQRVAPVRPVKGTSQTGQGLGTQDEQRAAGQPLQN
jgi:hypothetical protein